MSESVTMMIKFALYGIGILMIIFLLAVITPKLAAFVDKLAAKKKKPERVDDNSFPDVKGIYDAQLPTKEDEEKAKEVRGIYDLPDFKKKNKSDNGDDNNG